MKKIMSIILVSVVLISCNNNSTEKNSESNSTKSFQIEELLTSAAELSNQEVTVNGMVVHVCKHGGQKMFISGGQDENKIMIRVSPSIPEFDVALEGSNVSVTGKLIAEIVPEATEHQEKAAKEEDCDSSDETEEEDCAFEKTDAEQNIVYHIVATSFKEIEE